MFTADIKKEERDSMFSPTNVYLIALMAVLTKVMKPKYLRKVDKDAVLVVEVYRIAQSAAAEIEQLETPAADKFMDAMKIDAKGNLVLELDGHSITLVRHHKPTRKMTKEQDEAMIKVSVNNNHLKTTFIRSASFTLKT